MMVIAQRTRDAVSVVGSAVALGAFIHNLYGYVENLQRPGVLILAFSLSLVIALFYDIKDGLGRVSLVRAMATVVTFVFGLVVAHWLHDLYSQMMLDIAQIPGSEDVFGADYFHAIKNRVVGYGACFGAGVAITRVIAHKTIVALLVKGLVRPEHRPTLCPCCQQPVNV